jgi:CheY-like chemotaxis protein
MTFGTDSVNGKRILVVDDNTTNCQILKSQLELWKYEPSLASSGVEALTLMQNTKPFDLVLTDMQMPGMDGVQLAKKIREEYPQIPIVVLSSLGDTTYKKHVNLFSAILTKPIKHSQLYNEILHQFRIPSRLKKVNGDRKKKMSEEFAQNFPAKILVAEDNLVNQMVIKKILQRLGYNPEFVLNGIGALESYQKKTIDIILMDVQMPEMDGLEATRQIRRGTNNQPVIIALTASAMQSDRDNCMAAGMDDYLSKPIVVEDLMDKLGKWAVLARV